MKFEWDEAKNHKNIEKHGISFVRAIQIFEGNIISMKDFRKEYGEIRIRSIGMVEDTVVIVVVHTDRNNITRVISARPANKKERRMYYEKATQ